jgi:hypothetical protein
MRTAFVDLLLVLLLVWEDSCAAVLPVQCYDLPMTSACYIVLPVLPSALYCLYCPLTGQSKGLARHGRYRSSIVVTHSDTGANSYITDVTQKHCLQALQMELDTKVSWAAGP